LVVVAVAAHLVATAAMVALRHLVHKPTQLAAAVAAVTTVVAPRTVEVKDKMAVTEPTFRLSSVSRLVILIVVLAAVVVVRCWGKAAWVAVTAPLEETVETVRAVLTVLVLAMEVTLVAVVVELVGRQVAAQCAAEAKVAALESST
jgi:hypothetical protein